MRCAAGYASGRNVRCDIHHGGRAPPDGQDPGSAAGRAAAAQV